MAWVGQAVVAFVGAYVVIGPIFEKDFHVVGRGLDPIHLGVIMFFVFPIFWIPQLVATPFLVRTTPLKTALIWLGAYLCWLGPSIVFGHVLASRVKLNPLWHWVIVAALTPAFLLVFYFLFQLYTVTIFDGVVRLLMGSLS